jgi:hypothetical protein
MAMPPRCPVCQAPLPDEHWRVLADHAACRKPVPSAPETGHAQEGGAVESIVTAMNPSVDIQELDK